MLASLLSLAIPAAGAQDAAQAPWTAPSPDGEASVLVLEGERARPVVGGGLEVAAGSTVNAAMWFRDPPSADQFGLTDALEFVLVP